ncbi:MAG TPA: ATP-binding cassette domain-containing protein [bacterium (Candidatus Stahlbacteria)]|nr:ATP-binding cassette domain-containing protein [Candidatus Stahlbacteria bacterium]
MVEAVKLTKIYNQDKKNQVLAVDQVSFQAHNGEILGILGPNGAGKTTLLRMIATILKPSSGTAMIDGYNLIGEDRGVRKRVGFLTGATRLYDRLTVWETLTYFGRLYNINNRDLNERIGQLLAIFNLEDVKNRQIAELSDGMRQKVTLGRTIIHDPQNLLLDEPLTGLDILARRSATRFIREMKRQNRCIILSTHIMIEAEELCDRIVIIDKGRILITGSQDMLKERCNCTELEEVFIQLLKEDYGQNSSDIQERGSGGKKG